MPAIDPPDHIHAIPDCTKLRILIDDISTLLTLAHEGPRRDGAAARRRGGQPGSRLTLQ